ncbi:roadblock/LC7 domain-containing protein [Streptomyces sp. IBSNAI002]|uniref:roadblock/LC7 domain-containing protein n=1 Tax=Streptomyces sp. IBSNAI002 TaxID=3457500 RepID=UPI003FD2B598
MSSLHEHAPASPHLPPPAAQDGVGEFRWILRRFLADLPGAFDVAVVSADGLLLGRVHETDAPESELVAPLTGGLAALAGAAAELGGSGAVLRTILEMQHGIVAVVSVSDGSLLAVAADASSDRSLLGYQMTRLVHRMGRVLTPELRSTLREHAAATA